MSGRPQLLVVDDDPIFLKLAAKLLSAEFEVSCAATGAAAMESFLAHTPDVVMVDLGLPDIDGFEVVRRIKTELGGHIVPIIVVSATTDTNELARALAAGADDVISKPFDYALISRKLEAAARTRERLLHLESERAELARYYRQTETDHRAAQTLVASLLQRGCLDEPYIRVVMSPLSVFNADFVVAARTRDGRLRGMLGDFAGHGLTAAIGTMPTADIFYGATANNAPLEAVLRQINAKLRATMPRDLFCAAALFEIDLAAGRLTIWNGALPDLWLRHADGRIESLPSTHLALGILDEADFDESVQHVPIAVGARLFGCTDGFTEQSNDAGELFGLERVGQAYSRPECDIDMLLDAVKQFRGGRAAADDVTLLEVEIGPQLLAPVPGAARAAAQNEGRGVRLSLELGADMFTPALDLVALVNQALISSIPMLATHSGQLFTIVAELVNNAVDYGVLKLDAQVKDAADGFAAYYVARARALAQVTHGWIRVEANLQQPHSGGELVLRVLDSGPGIMPSLLTRVGQRRGRGIKLLQSLCREVRTLPGGRGVEVVYSMKDEALAQVG